MTRGRSPLTNDGVRCPFSRAAELSPWPSWGSCSTLRSRRRTSPRPSERSSARAGDSAPTGPLYASVSLSHRTGDYILRGAQAFDFSFGVFTLGGSALEGGGWNRELTEGALLYGRRARPGWGWVRGALGVGYIDTEQLSPVAPGEEPSTSAIGLAAQGDVAWTPNSWLGLGLTGVGNFNDLRSFGALTLSLHLGRSR
jgi:hypothetical protein